MDRQLLMWCHRSGRTDPRVRSAPAAQHDITRGVYREARKGIALLAPRRGPVSPRRSPCIPEILDRIEEIDFAVFSERASVSLRRRGQVFGTGLVRAWRARRADTSPRGDLTAGAA